MSDKTYDETDPDEIQENRRSRALDILESYTGKKAGFFDPYEAAADLLADVLPAVRESLHDDLFTWAHVHYLEDTYGEGFAKGLKVTSTWPAERGEKMEDYL